MHGRYKYIVRAVSFIVSAVLILLAVPSAQALQWDLGNNKAESTVAEFLKASKLKDSDNKEGIDFKNLKTSDARFIGIFMTNYMSPTITELTLNGDKKESDKNREGMIKVLSDQFGFKDGDAQILVDYVIEEMRKSSKELKWYFSDKQDATNTEGMIDGSSIPATYWNLQKNISGEFGFGAKTSSDGSEHNGENCGVSCTPGDSKRMLEYWKKQAPRLAGDDPAVKTVKEVYEKQYRYAYLADGSGHIAFNIDLTGEYTTPSVQALALGGASQDVKYGYGTSFFDYSKDEYESELGGNDQKRMDEVKNYDKFGSTQLGQKLMFDSFGSINVKGDNHSFMLLPGGANPWTWVTADGKSGSVFNAANSLSIAGSSQGALFSSQQGASKDNHGIGSCKVATGGAINSRRDSISDSNGIALRATRGSDESNFDAGNFGLWQVNNVGGTAVSHLMEKYTQGDGQRQSYEDYIEGQKGLRDAIRGYYFGGAKNGTVRDNNVPCQGNFILGDLLGQYEGDKADPSKKDSDTSNKDSKDSKDSKDKDSKDSKDSKEGSSKSDTSYSAFHVYSAIQSNGRLGIGDGGNLNLDNASKMWNSDIADKSGYGSTYEPDKALDQPTAISLYLTYLIALNGSDEAKKELGFSVNDKNLPDITTGEFQISKEAENANKENAQKQRANELVDFLWYWLKPDATAYFVQWVVNKLTAFIADSHMKMAGTTNGTPIPGSVKYNPTSSAYVIPALDEIPGVSDALHWVQDNYILLVLIFVALLLLYVVVGVISWSRAVAGILLALILIPLPLGLLNVAIHGANDLNTIQFGNKLNQWALMQHQMYSDDIDKAATGENYENWLATQWNSISATDISSQKVGANPYGGESVIVKWQGAKKMRSLVLGKNEIDKSVVNMDSQFANYALKALNRAGSGQMFTGDDNDTYLYRSYIDLSNVSRYVYRGIANGGGFNSSPDTSSWDKQLAQVWSERSAKDAQYMQRGYGISTQGSSTSGFRLTPMLGSRIVSDTFDQKNHMQDLNQSVNLGIDTRSFNFGLPAFTKDGTSNLMSMVEDTTTAYSGKQGFALADGFTADQGKGYTNEDYVSLAAFGLMSESPYYWFSWNLYDQGISPETGSSDNYKKLLLGDGGVGYFYNTNAASKGNGEMRDFLDMRGLFTYTIPYLRQANDAVDRYRAVHGLTYHEGVPSVEGHWDDPDIKNDPVLAQQYWENLQISRLYGAYTPWVDLMLHSEYAKAERINFQDEKITIADPLNPASYPANRPMVFSKSEQTDWGIADSDLTTVEKKIQEVQKKSYDSMFQLLNNYNYKDYVLDSNAAMSSTFAFNEVFSEPAFIGGGSDLYPKSWELKNFSYDAMLRLVMANNSDLKVAEQSGNDFYIKLIYNSSLFTGIMLLLLDVVSVYVLPFMMIAIVLMVALTLVCTGIIILLSIAQLKDVIKSAFKGILLPIVGVFVVLVAMGWLLSSMMSNGSTAVTGYSGLSINLGSPTAAIFALLVIELLALVVMVKLGFMSYCAVRSAAEAVWGSAKGVFQGTVSMVGNMAHGMSFSEARSNAARTTESKMSGGEPSVSPEVQNAVNNAPRGNLGNAEEVERERRNKLFGRLDDTDARKSYEDSEDASYNKKIDEILKKGKKDKKGSSQDGSSSEGDSKSSVPGAQGSVEDRVNFFEGKSKKGSKDKEEKVSPSGFGSSNEGTESVVDSVVSGSKGKSKDKKAKKGSAQSDSSGSSQWADYFNTNPSQTTRPAKNKEAKNSSSLFENEAKKKKDSSKKSNPVAWLAKKGLKK